jgi:hypothetical protein
LKEQRMGRLLAGEGKWGALAGIREQMEGGYISGL